MLMLEKMRYVAEYIIRERINPLNGDEISDESVITFLRIVVRRYRESQRIVRAEVNTKLDAALSVIGNELDNGKRMEFFADRAKRYLKDKHPSW
jgi:hypothetical protein